MKNCNAPNGAIPVNRMSPSCAMTGEEFPVAMAYVPWQQFGTPYDADKGLMAGTIFPALDKPFLGRRAFRR